MFNFSDDKNSGTGGQRTPEQCPLCENMGTVLSNMIAEGGRRITRYICYQCNFTWDDPPSSGGSSYGSGPNNPLGDDHGGDLSTLIGKR